MKKLFLSILCTVFLLPSLCMAQASSNMRALAIDQMYEYGQALFQRGDYPQAAIVFTRILAMDPNNKGAVDIAKSLQRKGQAITIPPQAEILTPAVAQSDDKTVAVNNYGNIFKGKAAVTSKVEEAPLAVSTSSAMDVAGNNRDLKQDIQDTDQSIEQLKKDIAQLRTQIATGQEDLSNSKKENLLK